MPDTMWIMKPIGKCQGTRQTKQKVIALYSSFPFVQFLVVVSFLMLAESVTWCVFVVVFLVTIRFVIA